MTPEQARNRLARVNVNQHERDALRTIANMRPEYIVQGRYDHDTEWADISKWSQEIPPQDLDVNLTSETGETYHLHTRIVVRYVTNPQPLGDNQ